MPVNVILTISYLLVIAGSFGMIGFATRFPLSTRIADLSQSSERLLRLNGHQVWRGSWGAIILGSAGQLLASWLKC